MVTSVHSSQQQPPFYLPAVMPCPKAWNGELLGNDGRTGPVVRKGSLHQQLTWEGDSVRSQTPCPEPSSDVSCSTIPQKSPTLGGTTKGFKVLRLCLLHCRKTGRGRSTPEPLFPPFRGQIGKLRTIEGKCAGQAPQAEGAGQVVGKGTSQLQLPCVGVPDLRGVFLSWLG